MSDLHRQMLKNQAISKHPIQKNEDSDNDEDEEAKDQFVPLEDVQVPVKLLAHGPPIKPIHMKFNEPNIPIPSKPKTKIHDYVPQTWDQFFDEMIYMENGTPIYIAGINNNPMYLCLHGAGHSALSFALVAAQIKKFGMCVSFDFRGHGNSKIQDDQLSAQQLIEDTIEVVQFLINRFPDPTIILVGHSMGGSVATKSVEVLLQSSLQDRIQGLIVLDVVEGTAIEALPFMETIVNARPKSFKSYEQAIRWSLNTSTLKNLESARVSIPPQLIEIKDENQNLVKLEWKVDLLKSDKYWMGWFKGLTNSFLNIRIPKLLMLAERERMDKDLTVAQMQGKFKLVVLYQTGHSIQEDDPLNTAINFHEFLTKFRVPTTMVELQLMKNVGIGKFHPKIHTFTKDL